jgi:hypothetical protein
MANLNVNTTIKAPENIEIELVRLDALSTSNNYRTFFEIFLSASSALLGVILSIQTPTSLHWVFFAVMAISSAVFLYLSVTGAKKARV